MYLTDFAFSKICESEADDTMTSRGRTVAASNEQMPLGVGRHAWYVFQPTAILLTHHSLLALDDSLLSTNSRSCVAYIVAIHDIKFEEGNGVPRDVCIAEALSAGNAI